MLQNFPHDLKTAETSYSILNELQNRQNFKPRGHWPITL